MNPKPMAILLVCTGIVGAVLFIYGQTRAFDFINLDDEGYVYGNANVQSGFTARSVAWAFTNNAMSNWHPFTWLSHMLDCRLFGLRAGAHHLVNTVLHAVASLLLFAALLRMTGTVWPSCLVAMLFAVHPLHVESVAWISERKDVLSAVFLMSTLPAYDWYAQKPGAARYAAVMILFAFGLMSKPMLVTVPLLLLLIDLWPLRRLTGECREAWMKSAGGLCIEKLPLFAMSVAVGIVTFVVQRNYGAVASLQTFTLGQRLGNAVTAYAKYLVMMAYPADLAIPYPHPGPTIPLWQLAGSGLLLAAVTVMTIVWVKGKPYLLAGWGWYLVSLAPVIGLVQVGPQALADRYTYIPLIGIFIVIAWGARDLAGTKKGLRYTVAAGFVVWVSVLAYGARVQTGYWRNSETLFTRALAVNEVNPLAHNNLGTALMAQGRFEEAAGHFRRSIEIAPGNIDALSNLGAACLLQGDSKSAGDIFAQVVQMRPRDPTAYSNLGLAQLQQGRTREAVAALRRALELDPNCYGARQILSAIGELAP